MDATTAMPSLGLTLGAIEVGTLITSVIYGMSLVQTYTFYCWRDDRTWLKFAVAAVCLFETLHIVFMWMYLYHLTVTQFGNPTALVQMPWYFGVAVTLQATAGTIVQCLFIWRVFVLSEQRWYLTIVPGGAALAKEVASIMSTVLSLKAISLPDFQQRYGYVIYIATICSVVTDVWNTALLCWFLRSRRTVHNHGVVNWIMVWALETGFLTTVTAILIVIFWATMPTNCLWLVAVLIYSHLYSNALMVSLNHRSSDRKFASSEHRVSTRSGQARSEPRGFDLSSHDDFTAQKKKGTEGLPIAMDNLNKIRVDVNSYCVVEAGSGLPSSKYVEG